MTEYVFMTFDTLQDLRAAGKVTGKRGVGEYYFYEGKKVLTVSRRCTEIPRGEIWEQPTDGVKADIRRLFENVHRTLPVPDVVAE